MQQPALPHSHVCSRFLRFVHRLYLCLGMGSAPETAGLHVVPSDSILAGYCYFCPWDVMACRITGGLGQGFRLQTQFGSCFGVPSTVASVLRKPLLCGRNIRPKAHIQSGALHCQDSTEFVSYHLVSFAYCVLCCAAAVASCAFFSGGMRAEQWIGLAHEHASGVGTQTAACIIERICRLICVLATCTPCFTFFPLE